MISYEVQQFGTQLAKTERETPRPEGRQVLLRVLATGVCHTDIHIWQGGYDLGGGEQLSMAARGISPPLTLGHEIVGEVLATGPHAETVSLGRRYLIYPWIGCGTCKVCLRETEQVCTSPRYLGIMQPGGYSDHVLVPDSRYLIDIGDMPAEQAAPYACSGLTVYSALRKINPAVLAEEPVVIFGAGGLGLMAITLLDVLGGAGAVVVETDATRREAAVAAGAIAAIDPLVPDFADQVKNAAGGNVWAVLDCVGAAQTVQASLDLLVKGGQFIQVGLLGGRIQIPTPVMPLRSISYHGSFAGSLPELQDLMTLVGQRPPLAIPTCCRPLETASAALNDLEHGRVVGRLILQPHQHQSSLES
ncbi:alcohol dehydrogenase [Pseudomonas sp. WN033]|nr:alcohol dehydrogenase [Pseudomonas sp. WN033]